MQNIKLETQTQTQTCGDVKIKFSFWIWMKSMFETNYSKDFNYIFFFNIRIQVKLLPKTEQDFQLI